MAAAAIWPVGTLLQRCWRPKVLHHLQETKRLLRGDFAEQWAAYAETEVAGAWKLLSSPSVMKQLGGVLERLGGGAQKKSAASRL